jgi:N,N'-diacetyllegionaminate synthase
MNKTYILAEIAQGFEGDINLVRRLIKVAKKSGADGIKFQIFKASELCLQDYQYYDLFKSLEIDPTEWTKAIDEAVAMGLDFWSDIYGVETLGWISKTKAKGFKIHSTDSKNFELLNSLKDKGYNILLSTGGSSFEEVKSAVQALGKNNITLLSGFQAEPNQYSDVELEKITHLKEQLGLPVGYADHIDANDDLAVTLPGIAVLKGVSMIEKHLTIDRNNLQLEDYISALNPDEFAAMVAMIRKVEQFNHNKGFVLSEREETYRKKTKKVVLASRTIAKGEVIQRADVTMLRTGKAYDEIIDMEEIIGKRATQEVKKHDVISRKYLSEQ